MCAATTSPERVLAVLYPADVPAVASHESVDLGYRMLWTFLAETGWRVSEAVGRQEPERDDARPGDEPETVPRLVWRDVDVAHEKAILARTKTTGAVEVPLDEWTIAGLRAWRAISPRRGDADRVFVTRKGEPITVVLAADTFRAHLNLAGITRQNRPDLHDLRALFATALAQGRSDTWVRERGRWEAPQMLDRYRRQVPHFRKYGPITPMVEAAPDRRERCRPRELAEFRRR